MKAWSRKSPDVRRREILAAAGELLIRVGAERLSMTELADRARVSRGTLYQHFPSRETLLRELLSDFMQGPRARARTAAALEAPVAERLFGVLDSYVGMAYAWAYESQAGADFLTAADGFGGDLFEAETRRHLRLLAAVLRSAHESGEIDLNHASWSASDSAELLHGAAHGVAANQGQLMAPGRLARRLRFLVDAFVRQLQPKAH